MPNDRVAYLIKDELGKVMRFTLKKLYAEVLEANLPNPIEWLQAAYNRVAAQFPMLTREQKCKKVRWIAFNETGRFLDLK